MCIRDSIRTVSLPKEWLMHVVRYSKRFGWRAWSGQVSLDVSLGATQREKEECPRFELVPQRNPIHHRSEGCLSSCLLYTSDAADDLLCVDLGGRRIIKKKKKVTI
eukprot:TRINITY_DN4773_c0_g1_i2.p2 TRINITY_DN4773_c0_g1~~TRINITY_DN4773_c0_g1_i2.p2  ORF type:complete len:106 (+),score=36.01 TRINITY_DN4773_c0_g1_i2:179-496(+)